VSGQAVQHTPGGHFPQDDLFLQYAHQALGVEAAIRAQNSDRTWKIVFDFLPGAEIPQREGRHEGGQQQTAIVSESGMVPVFFLVLEAVQLFTALDVPDMGLPGGRGRDLPAIW
jgi:hypothetical protein